MKQAKELDSFDDPTRHAWPTALRAAFTFTPVGDPPPGLLVHFLDYAIFSVIQLTRVAETPLIITDLTVNGEFRPVLTLDALLDRFLPLRWPQPMKLGDSLGAVLQAPASHTAPECCYPKSPEFLLLDTTCGQFGLKPMGTAKVARGPISI